MAEWRFRKMGRDEIRSDPVEGEFFTPERLAEALVRESVQNSLDAKSDGVVRVQFSFYGGEDGLGPAIGQRYLDGLMPHVAASNIGTNDRLPQEMPYIVVEDFGTRGLSGDPSQTDDSIDLDGKNDFYYFWRNIGRSVKSATDRGRWGLGKTVFPATSRINSFFALSAWGGAPDPTLMGQSVLKTHQIGADHFYPYGYFANFEPDGFAMPLSDPLSISQFKEDFHLSRGDEAGLSVVIPLPRAEDLQHNEVVRFAIIHYFYPILAGELILEFKWAGQSTVLDRRSIRSVASTIDWAAADMTRGGLEATLDLAAWAIALPEDNFVILQCAGEHGIPKWEAGLFDPALLPALQTRFERDERIAIRAPITIELKPRRKVTSFFEVFLERDLRLARGEDHYLRQGLTVSDIHMLGDRKVRGFVVIRDPGLSTLLGDTENPSHTEWRDRSGHLEEGYIQGPSRLRFVKKSLPSIIQFLSRPPSGLDERLLEDIFSIDLPPDEIPPLRPPRGAQAQPGDKQDQPPVVVPPPADRPFRIQQTEGGFRVKGNPAFAQNVSTISIEVAYEVRRGNPFKKYRPFDFRFDASPINVATTLATIDAVSDNKLRLTSTSADFEVEVTGFDRRRDLRVRVVPLGGDA
jgi:hypothetical protein